MGSFLAGGRNARPVPKADGLRSEADLRPFGVLTLRLSLAKAELLTVIVETPDALISNP